MSNNDEFIKLVDAAIGRYFDSNPITFNTRHKKVISKLTKHLNTTKIDIFELKKPILRNTFLYSCREFTKNEPIEHLIIGYGQNRGGGTDIMAVQHVIGDANSVKMPDIVAGNINTWLSRVEKPGIVVYHNHPKGGFDEQIGITFPSQQDRRFKMRMKIMAPLIAIFENVRTSNMNIFQAVSYFFFTQRIKFYVSYGIEVIEIKGVSIIAVMEFIDTVFKNGR